MEGKKFKSKLLRRTTVIVVVAALFVTVPNNVVQTRALSLGIVGFATKNSDLSGRPSERNEGGVFLDISYDTHSVVSLNNIKKKEQEYMLNTGIYSSEMEHKIIDWVV